jgi:23S rRNA (guanosine2251-2'-O)-methyltransferase
MSDHDLPISADEHLFGRKPVLEALRAGEPIERVYVQFGVDDRATREMLAIARNAGIHVAVMPRDKFKVLAQRLGDPQHQGIIAVCAAVPLADIDDILARARERKEPPFIIALDSIMDPRNVGAIVRSAECAGAHGVITLKHHSAPIGGTVAKTSAGAVFHIPVARVPNLSQAIARLKEENCWVVGTDGTAAKEYTQYDFRTGTVIVIGNEGEGMRESIRKSCDDLVRIPLMGKVDSLNAAVAAGVLMYEVVRQRRI